MTEKEEQRLVTRRQLWSDTLWNSLPLAPKHTDEEYQFRMDDIEVLEGVIKTQQSRIKELDRGRSHEESEARH